LQHASFCHRVVATGHARSGRILQADQPARSKAAAPAADRRSADAQPRRDSLRRIAVRRGKDNPRPLASPCSVDAPRIQAAKVLRSSLLNTIVVALRLMAADFTLER